MAIQSVKATINGQEYTLELNSTSGKYEKSVTAPATTSYNQPGGYYPVRITAADTAGNTVTADATHATLGAALQLIVKEKTPPVITITQPGAGAILAADKPQIKFTLRDEADGSGVKLSSLALKIDGGTSIGQSSPGMTCTPVTGGYDCTYTVQTALSAASHTVTIDVQDNDGNRAAQKSVTFTVDTSAPTLSITSPPEGYETNQPSLSVQMQTNNSSMASVTLTMKLNNTDQGSITVNSDGTASKQITLREGANTIYVKATGANGLFNEVTRTVYLDTTPPVIDTVSITPNPADAGATVLISVTIHDA